MTIFSYKSGGRVSRYLSDYRDLTVGDLNVSFNLEDWWEDLDQLEVTVSDLSKSLAQVIKSIDVHLGIIFHRFISDSRIEIVIDQWNTDEGSDGVPTTVKALDPFGYDRSGKEGYIHLNRVLNQKQ